MQMSKGERAIDRDGSQKRSERRCGLRALDRWLRAESGAVTVDMVVLIAAGIMFVYAAMAAVGDAAYGNAERVEQRLTDATVKTTYGASTP